MQATRFVSIWLLFAIALNANAQASPKFLPRLSKRSDFDLLSRVTTTPYTLPHVLFLIDRSHGDKVYYIDSKRTWHHREFANAMYLTLENNEQFLKNNYLNANRRFILGWVCFHTPIDRWGFEFWEGDQTTPALVSEASKALDRSFFTPLAFKPNSLQQEDVSAKLKIQRILPSELATAVPYQPLNLATSVGKLTILDSLDQDTIVSPDDIVVVKQLPIVISPVAGLISASPASALSHLNILARSWDIPSAYVKDALTLLRPLDGKNVFYETKAGAYTLRLATQKEIAEAASHSRTSTVVLPKANLSVSALTHLRNQRGADVNAFGTKSANLGEVDHAQIPNIIVPNGFTIPFFWYARFIEQSSVKSAIRSVLDDPQMKSDPAHRKAKLAELRKVMQKSDIDHSLRDQLLSICHREYSGKGLFVRSSTNAEDLPNFSGAGLYTTVPNVVDDDAIIDAVKTVWASVWNDGAYAAREQAGLPHDKVYMAVLLQIGINAESAGVMITVDPFDPDDADAVFVSAKRGLGIKVVEGQKVPEQLILHKNTNAIQVLTRSQEDSLLTFDSKGGLKEIPTYKDRAVLTDDLVRRLANAAQSIKNAFGSDQDIEWAYMKGTIYIVQSRPYKN